MQNAIIVFTKVPEVGKVKTRLTEERGGILTPEEAKDFYQASLLDVIDVCTEVDNARVWICCNCEGDRDYLDLLITELNKPDKIAGIFSDHGGKFDECMQFAADFILKPGSKDKLAESMIIVGGDAPLLQPRVLDETIRKLEILSKSEAGRKAAVYIDNSPEEIGAAVVESADQEGGFNVVGYTCNTPFNFTDVFYNMDGVTTLDMLANKTRQANIPVLPVEMVPDVDLPVDIGSLLPVLNVMVQAAEYDSQIIVPRRTVKVLGDIGLQAFAGPGSK